MFIQGNLQNIFDALYNLGVIDPVLKSDWAVTEKEMQSKPTKVTSVITAANKSSHNVAELLQNLNKFDKESLTFLALEVAREFADFQTRKTIH